MLVQNKSSLAIKEKLVRSSLDHVKKHEQEMDLSNIYNRDVSEATLLRSSALRL